MTTKVSQLVEDTNPTGDDFVLATDNATAASKKVTMGNLVKAGLPTQTGNSGKLLTTDGSALSWGGVSLVTGVTGVLPVANGGTGSATQNFVDLTTAQTKTGGLAINKAGGAFSLGTATNVGIQLVIDPGLDANKGIVVFAHSATQSASLIEVQNSAFTPVFTVDKAGAVTATNIAVSSTGAQALVVGPNGTTNPTLQADGSTASAATGLKVKSAAAAAGLALSVISSGTNENLTIDAKGSGTITLGGTSTGNLIVGRSISLIGNNIITDGTFGMRIGTATTQKLAFYNSTPVVQPTGDVITALQNLGLVASATISEADVTSLTTDLAAKQATITLTTTGTSGAATLTGATLNIPNYAAGSGMTNPMTTLGDIITGGASGTPSRLAVGSAAQVLIGGTTPAWGSVDLTSMVGATILPIANGGTGSATQNFVDLSSTQSSIGGAKTFVAATTIHPSTDVVPLILQTSTASPTSSMLRILSSTSSLVFGVDNSFNVRTENVIPLANGTYTSGSTSNYWSNLYATTLNLNSTASLDGSTAGTVGITGNIVPTSGYTYDAGSAPKPFNNVWAGFAVNIQNAGINTQIIAGANGTSQTLTLPLGTDTIVAKNSTDILTNKRITKRTGTVASSATPTINTDNVDVYTITALAAAITSMTTSLSGTPNQGDKLLLGFKDNGTARAITWGASFKSSGVATLLATTVVSKQHWVELMYDGSSWVCLAVDATGY